MSTETPERQRRRPFPGEEGNRVGMGVWGREGGASR
jgi:hypothetical protein